MPALPIPTRCPRCGYALERAVADTDDSLRPVPGSVAVCLRCRGPAVFGPDMQLRMPTVAEVVGIIEMLEDRLDELPGGRKGAWFPSRN